MFAALLCGLRLKFLQYCANITKMGPCAQCSQDIATDSEIACDICSKEFCCGCLQLTASELKVVPMRKRSLVICCRECRTAVFDALINRAKVCHLQSCVDLLNNTIKDKNVIIEDKTNIINLMEESADKGNKPPLPLEASIGGSMSLPSSNVDNAPIISKSQVRNAVESAITATKRDSTAGDAKSSRRVTSRSAQLASVDRRNVIRGSNDSIPGLKAAERMKSFYIGNLGSQTTSEQLRAHLEGTSVSVICCEKLQRRDPCISSFKLTVAADQIQEVLRSELWPTNVVVRPFVANPRFRRQHDSRGLHGGTRQDRTRMFT